jgi:hypothetical protein
MHRPSTTPSSAVGNTSSTPDSSSARSSRFPAGVQQGISQILAGQIHEGYNTLFSAGLVVPDSGFVSGFVSGLVEGVSGAAPPRRTVVPTRPAATRQSPARRVNPRRPAVRPEAVRLAPRARAAPPAPSPRARRAPTPAAEAAHPVPTHPALARSHTPSRPVGPALERGPLSAGGSNGRQTWSGPRALVPGLDGPRGSGAGWLRGIR